MISHQVSDDARSQPSVVLYLLPDNANCHVHAVYDPYADFPESVCGLSIHPTLDYVRGGPIIFCGRCLACAADDAKLVPAAHARWTPDQIGTAGLGPALLQWWRPQWLDLRMRCALVVERRRHG